MSRLICCRLVAVFVCVIALASAVPASAQGQSQTRRPVDPGRPAERIKPDAPRLGRNAPLVANATTPTNDIRIDALLSSYRWPSGTTTITYSFYSNAVFNGSYYGTETVSEVSPGVKANVRAIMAWYSTMMNINLVEVNETANNIGLIRIMDSTAPGYAYAYYPYSTAMFDEAGDVHLQVTYDFAGSNTNGFQNPAGEHGYVSLIHEIGHALGLKHPHDSTPNLSTADDNHTHTVMSYQFYGESPGTPMGFDIMALQYLYGARGYRTSGDTYLVSNSALDQYTLGGATFIAGSLRTKQAIDVLPSPKFTALGNLGEASVDRWACDPVLDRGTVRRGRS
jgi:serralysin